MINGFIQQCDICKVTSKKEESSFFHKLFNPRFQIPGILFLYLNKCSFICEKCVAAKMGINEDWCDWVKDELIFHEEESN